MLPEPSLPDPLPMPAQMLDVFGMSSITTTGTGGVDNNGGYMFVLGSDAVTLLPGSTSHVILVIDDTDGCFDDDQGTAQRLDGDQVLSGTIYAGGSDIASEQSVTLRSPGGATMTRCSSYRRLGGHEKRAGRWVRRRPELW